MITPTTSGSREMSARSRSRLSAAGPPTSALAGSSARTASIVERSSLAALPGRGDGGQERTAARALRGRDRRDARIALQHGRGTRQVALGDHHLEPARRTLPERPRHERVALA